MKVIVFTWRSFPRLFDDHLFTPTLIKNLLREATSVSKKVELTSYDIYFSKRELETNRTYVKVLLEKLKEYRVHFIEYFLSVISSYSRTCELKEIFSYSDILKLEWFRFMHLEILRREISKLQHTLQQLKLNFIEAKDLIDEVEHLHRKANVMNTKIKDIVRIYQILYMN